MPTSFIPNVKNVEAAPLRFRWFTCNCYQFMFPNGKTFVVDPFLLPKGYTGDPHFSYMGFETKDLGSAEYVFINHGHGDHIGTLKETWEKYDSRILAQDTTAAVLSRDLDIPQTAFFPYAWNQTYDFGDFTLTTLPARHNGNRKPSDRIDMKVEDALREAGFLGTLFNTNFILETKNHFRIGFCAGVFRDGEIEKNSWKGKGCNIFIRQYGGRIKRNDAAGLAREFMETGASLLLPMHQERFYAGKSEGDVNGLVAQVNAILEAEEYAGRALAPECGHWYTVKFAAVYE